MSDVILQTHPLEFQNSRQATKITYLQHEITHLQDNVRDFEELVRINKEAMKIMSNQYSQSNNKTKSSSQEDITSSTIDQHSSPQSNKNFYALSEQLQEENARLLEMIQKLKRDRAVAQSKALLSEQIMEEVQRHEAEVVGELEQKVLDLRKMIQDKEFFIQQLEKTKPFPDQDGVVVKFREVMSATDQNMRLHEEINNYKFMIAKMATEINKVKSENQDLTNTNSRLNNELVKLKTMLANPMNSNKFSLKSLFTGRRQAKMNQSFNKSPLNIPSDDDLNSSKGSVQKLSCGGPTNKPSKFRDAQKLAVQKSDSPHYHSNPLLDMKLLEKISHLETELDSMKRRNNCEQINNGILSDELLKIKRICNDMMATNDILCKANKKNQEKWEQMSYAMEFYKAFYHKYMDLISKRKPQTRGAIMEIPNIEALKRINETLVTGLELTPVKLLAEREESDLSNKPECSKTPRRATKIVQQAPYHFTRQQAKAFLINLSKEFYATIHPALAALENSPTVAEEHEDKEVKCRTRVRRSKRSMSNALDYVCARRKLIFEPIQEEEPEDFRRAQRKGSLVNWNNAHGRGNEIGILALQVNRLASIKNSEHLSFSIDLEELDKVKATETSFISTNDFIQTLE